MVAKVRLRKPVRLRAGQRKRRSVKLGVGFVVRECPAPTMSVRQSSNRRTTPTRVSLRANSGGPALASVTFRVARALRPAGRERRRSWTRKAVGALTLRRANKTTFSAKLRAPRRVGRRLVFRLADGVAVTWMRRSVDVSGLPEGTSGVWLRLDGTRRLRPYTNPARKATIKHSARLVARDQSAATVSRTLKIAAR